MFAGALFNNRGERKTVPSVRRSIFLFIVLLVTLLGGGFCVWRFVVERFGVKREYLYYPSNWKVVSALIVNHTPRRNNSPVKGVMASGGTSDSGVPVRILYYVAKKGDTLSGIAEKFHLTLDTIASTNRRDGRGVHMLSIGERVKIPTVNGIYLTVRGDFERFCRKYDVAPDVVLEANGLESEGSVKGTKISFRTLRGKRLFFPGVQHTGIEKSIVIGVAFRKPVAGILTSGYGFRHDPFTHRIRFHRGVDLAAPVGTPVHCAMDGRVLAIGHDRILGNYILVKHPRGFSTLYAHLSRVLVHRGEFVMKGKKIGLVGMTGRATGPHLHFEIRYHGRAINPKGMVPGI